MSGWTPAASATVATGGPAMDDAALVDAGRRVLRMEAEAITRLEAGLDQAFARAVRLIREAGGRIIVSGIGKSGIVARKIAATLTSTGTPASFLHPVEGLHGDLGMVGDDDVALLVSKSGDSGEVGALVEHLLRRGVRIIAITGRRESTMARAATVILECTVTEEACPFDLAPTTSTTAALAMGDALAVALLLLRGFTAEDFARLHPGGALGRRLGLRVRDVMVTQALPWLPPDATMRRCIVLLAEKRGTVPIVDVQRRVIGVVTAGDLTRLMEKDEAIFDLPVSGIMTRSPKVTDASTLAVAAIHQMETHGIMALPVVDEQGVLTGIVHLHDLLRAGLR